MGNPNCTSEDTHLKVHQALPLVHRFSEIEILTTSSNQEMHLHTYAPAVELFALLKGAKYFTALYL